MASFCKQLIIAISLSFPASSFAFPEIPFCPLGGPPGWMNRFMHTHDRDYRRHNAYLASPAFAPPVYYRPPYLPRNQQPFHYYRPPPYSLPNRARHGASPVTGN